MANELTINNKIKTLQNLLEVSKKQIEMALPKHLTADRMLRIAVTELRKNPTLAECSQESFLGAIIQCSQLGLEPGGHLGHSYLVPFNNKKNNIKECQFVIGYKGLLALANQSPKTDHAIAHCVYDCDEFDYQYGSNPFITHKPNQIDIGKRGKSLTHAYAICFLKESTRPIFIVLSLEDIEAHRNNSKSKDYGPWKEHYAAMAKKSAIRDLFKFMPSSIELQTAIGLDEAAEREEQNNSSVIDAEGKTLPDENTVDQVAESLKKEKPKSAEKEKKEVAPETVEVSKEFAEMPDPRNRAEVSKSIMGLIRSLNISIDELEKTSLEKFKVNLKDCTIQNLEKLETELHEKMKGK